MHEGFKGWLLVAGWWFMAGCLALFLPYVVVAGLPPVARQRAWLLLAGTVTAGALAFGFAARRRFANAAVEISPERRQELRRNAQIGAGFGIFAAALLLRRYDSPWALIVIGGVFLGGIPVLALASIYLLIKRGHTL